MLVRTMLSAFLALGLLVGPTNAFEADRIVIKVGYAPGAAFDLIARSAAVHFGQYLPGNPQIIVENVEGAGSRRLLNLFLATGARDGTEVAMIDAGVALDPVLNPDTTNFDPREFGYLVSFSNTPTYCLTTTASGLTDLDKFLTEDVKIGAIGRGAQYFAAAAIERVFDANFTIVSGFSGLAEVILALARSDLDAVCGISRSSFDAMAAAFDFQAVAELSPVPVGVIEGAEFLLDRVTDPMERAALRLVFSPSQVWFPMIAHPDTPDETLAILRDAFAQLGNDEVFLAELRSRGIDVVVTDGATVQALVAQFLSADETVQATARALVE